MSRMNDNLLSRILNSVRSRGVYFLVSRCGVCVDMFDQAFRRKFALGGGNEHRIRLFLMFLTFRLLST